MSLKADSKYPSRRTYVVKLRADAMPCALTGRIENLVSGRQLEFTSGRDLLNHLSRDLLEHAEGPSVYVTGDER